MFLGTGQQEEFVPRKNIVKCSGSSVATSSAIDIKLG
jgi:hypothetical protein